MFKSYNSFIGVLLYSIVLVLVFNVLLAGPEVKGEIISLSWLISVIVAAAKTVSAVGCVFKKIAVIQ